MVVIVVNPIVFLSDPDFDDALTHNTGTLTEKDAKSRLPKLRPVSFLFIILARLALSMLERIFKKGQLMLTRSAATWLVSTDKRNFVFKDAPYTTIVRKGGRPTV